MPKRRCYLEAEVTIPCARKGSLPPSRCCHSNTLAPGSNLFPDHPSLVLHRTSAHTTSRNGAPACSPPSGRTQIFQVDGTGRASRGALWGGEVTPWRLACSQFLGPSGGCSRSPSGAERVRLSHCSGRVWGTCWCSGTFHGRGSLPSALFCHGFHLSSGSHSLVFGISHISAIHRPMLSALFGQHNRSHGSEQSLSLTHAP